MEILLRYGRTAQPLHLPTGTRVAILAPGRTDGAGREPDLIHAAMADPIGSPRLSRIASPGHSALQAARAGAMGLRPFAGLTAAAAAALEASGPDPFVVVMPEGGSILPGLAGASAAGR